MFKNSKVFSSFSVDSLKKAKKFYSSTLGLKVEEDKKMGMLKIPLDGHDYVMIYPKDNHKAATYTVLNLVVENVEQAVDKLMKKGIKFEKYKGFDQDSKGISRDWGIAIAWFKDPAGNIVSIIETQS